MIIAAIEGNIIALIVFAAIGVINWLLQKKEEQAAKRPDASTRERQPEQTAEVGPTTRPGQPQDDERLRRFMEALGLPTDQAPPPPVQRPQTPRPPPLPRTIRRAAAPQTPRVPHPPAETLRRPFREVTSRPPPLPERERSLDEADAPVLPVEQISLPVLETPALPEFVTISSRIAATAGGVDVETDAYRERTTLPPAAQGRVTELLRSPDDLRRAILLREILGPPRGIEQFGFRI